MNIRRLSPSDAAVFRALRLAALLETPEAFVASHEEEKDQPISFFEDRLVARPGHAVFGAFIDGTLAAVAGLTRADAMQLAHKCNLWGMVVAAPARGQGVARQLLQAVLDHARATPGVAKVTLSVDSANVAAIALYESLGFVVFAREADAVRLHGRSRDDLQMHLRFSAPDPAA